MKRNKRGINRARRFKPNSDFIQKAVEDYLKNGGKIRRIEIDEKSFENSWMINDVSSDVDEFLNGV